MTDPVEAPAMCTASACFQGADLRCAVCDKSFCDAHAHHPDHSSPIAGPLDSPDF